MASEKGKSSSSGDAKKSSKDAKVPSVFSVFAVGVIVGVLSGFILGWWYPAPDGVRDDIDSTKTATQEHIHDMADQARRKTADMLEQRAQQLRHPLGHTVNTPEPPVETIDQQESGVPVQ